MTFEEKVNAFNRKSAIQLLDDKTPIEDLPFEARLGSGSHHPESHPGIETADIVVWVKFLHKWFRPYGNFSGSQVRDMIGICYNDQQIIALMELLSAKKE